MASKSIEKKQIAFASIIAFTFLTMLANRTTFFTQQNKIETLYSGGDFETDTEAPEPQMACQIPKLNPFDESIAHLTSVTPEPAKCDEFYTQVFYQTTKNSLVRLNGTQEWTDCCYRVIGREFVAFGWDSSKLPIVSESEECYNLDQNETFIPPDHEFIGVYCTIPPVKEILCLPFYKERIDENHRTVVDTFAFTPYKLASEDRVAVLRRNHPELVPEDQLNVVIIGLDAVSHMNFKRTMPRVVEYLVKNLSAIGMNGFVRVGEDTFENSAAFLNNMTGNEVNSSCLEEEEYGDTCPLIWKDFAAHGYLTSTAEDWPRGELYAYRLSIVRHPPVDYHLQPLMTFAHTFTAGPKRSLSPICVGHQLTLNLVLQYVKTLAAFAGNSKRYFQFLWSCALTHDGLLNPTLGESSLLDTLKWLKNGGYLNNTMLLVTSDHGARTGGGQIVFYSQGKIEGNMPILYFVLPDWFQTAFPRAYQNLRTNVERLTTTFDIYATLKDVMHLSSQLGESELDERERDLMSRRGIKTRGISLFLPVPLDRTCETAEIPSTYCVCRNKVPVNITNPLVQEASAAAVAEINEILDGVLVCSPVELTEILGATQDTSAYEETWQFTPLDQVIEVEFMTSPGNATFLAVMSKKAKESEWFSSSKILRTNIYGNQSHCVAHTNRLLRSYCYCKDL